MAKKDDTKNVPITKELAAIEQINQTRPSDAEMSVITATFYRFRDTQQHRDQPWENFDGLKLVDYINDSVRRYITNVDQRTDIEDWQARVHDPFTRNKTLAVLGKVVQVLPIAEFSSRGDEDFRKAQILTDLYQYSEDVDEYEELMINVLLEAIIKGTAIGYEGQEIKTTSVRDVSGSGDDIKVTDNSRKTNRLYGTLVPLEDFYPSSVGVRKIKDMPFCFWRTTLPFQQFKMDFAMYSRVSEVSPKKNASPVDGEARPYYLDYISSDVQDGDVEILRYYNQDTDEFIILANGVWLNPLPNAVVSPLPFAHKELPFWDIRFELYVNFFYGKSLPDKLKSLQDVLNVLTNMLLDQSFLTIFPPILTAGFDSIEDDYLRPGRRTPVDTQGLPLKDQYMKMDLGVPQGWHQFILQYTRKVMEESSMDQVQSGVAGVGGRTTKAEIDTAAAGVTAIIGLFGRLIKYGLKRKALMRSQNILQFWTMSNSPMIEAVMGEGGAKQMSKAFNIFKVDNTVLTSGKRGLKVIEMYANASDKPTKKELVAKTIVSKLASNKEIEYIAMDADYIRDFQYDVKLAVNQKAEETKDMEKMIQLEKVRIYMSFFPNEVNKIELLAQTAEKLGDDPEKIIGVQQMQGALSELQQSTQDAAQKGSQAQPMGQTPQGTLPNQVMQKAMGKQLFDTNINMLRNQMTG